MTPQRSILAAQLARIRGDGLFDLLAASATAHGLPIHYVVAVASRETNCTNILGDWKPIDPEDPHGPKEAHGVGILQRDIQHADARQARDDGTWKTHPERMIEADVAELAANVASVHGFFDDVSAEEAFMIAACGYNCGITRAMQRAENDGDPNSLTTGGDYGRDVLARFAVFADLLGSKS